MVFVTFLDYAEKVINNDIKSVIYIKIVIINSLRITTGK